MYVYKMTVTKMVLHKIRNITQNTHKIHKTVLDTILIMCQTASAYIVSEDWYLFVLEYGTG